MHDGLYEQLLTEALEQRLAELGGHTADRVSVDAAEAPALLAHHVAEVLERELVPLAAELKPGSPWSMPSWNRIAAPPDPVLDGPQQLHALRSTQSIGADRFAGRPEIALGQAALLTNGRGEPALNAELAAEILTADSVDLLCAFVQWSGLRVLEHSLRRHAELGIPLRVITSTYVGATERRALDELVRRFDAEAQVSYEARTTRLHAKDWLFRRRTGFDTAYVGSSNLSRSALVSGLEWNVRLGAVATRELGVGALAVCVRRLAALLAVQGNDQVVLRGCRRRRAGAAARGSPSGRRSA